MNDAEENILGTNERFDQAEKDLTEATDELQSKNKLIRKVEAKLHAEEDENKRCLILIEGVPEKSKLKPREIAGNLLKELGIDFVESDIRTTYRMGQLQNNPKRGRAIKVKFSATYFKQEICKNVVKRVIKAGKGYISRMSGHNMSNRSKEEIFAISRFAKSKDIDVKVKGDKLIIDEKVFKHEDLDDLPHRLSIEKAKMIPVCDGWAFQRGLR